MAWLGVLGIWMIESSYIPQLWRLYRLKDAEDFSPWFPLMNLLGRLCAMVYAMSRGDSILAVGFLLGMGLRGALFVQVVYYKRRTRLLRQLEMSYAGAQGDDIANGLMGLEEVSLTSESQVGGLVALDTGMAEGRV